MLSGKPRDVKIIKDKFNSLEMVSGESFVKGVEKSMLNKLIVNEKGVWKN